MRQRMHLFIPILISALLGACATAPERIDQLEQARAAVQALAQDPQASVASQDLDAARNALAQADEAFKQRRDEDLIVHLAYVAQRHADIGQARISEARAREQVAQGEAERNRVLLEARTREAQQATMQARTAQAEAQAQAQAAQQSIQAAEQARMEAQQSRESAMSAQAQLESLQQQFADLQAKQTERGMVLTLGDVLFDTGESTLKPGAALALDRLAQFLNQNPDTRLIVEGHTDSRGSEDYNQDLSQRRADAVAQALQSRGIGADRFQSIGRGESFPVASNENPAGRQQNRRVEIIFSDQSGQFAQGATSGSSLR